MVNSFGNFLTGITANSATEAQTVNGWANVTNRGQGQDQITDFAALNFAEGGDVLDLRDLLSGEAIGPNGTVGNLANYLEFDTTSQPGTTLIHVSSKGQFTNGAYSAAAEDLTISLNGVDLRTALDLNAQATDAQLIEELLKRGNLIAGG